MQEGLQSREPFRCGSLPGFAADQLPCLRQALQSQLLYLENGDDGLPGRAVEKSLEMDSFKTTHHRAPE